MRSDVSGTPPPAAEIISNIFQMPPGKALGLCRQRCILPSHPSRVRCLRMVLQPTSGQQERLTGPGQSILALEPQTGPACWTRQGRGQQLKGFRGGPVMSLVPPPGAAPRATPSHMSGRILLLCARGLLMKMVTGGCSMGRHATMHPIPPSPPSARNLRRSYRGLWTARQICQPTPHLLMCIVGPSSSRCGSQQRMRSAGAKEGPSLRGGAARAAGRTRVRVRTSSSSSRLGLDGRAPVAAWLMGPPLLLPSAGLPRPQVLPLSRPLQGPPHGMSFFIVAF